VGTALRSPRCKPSVVDRAFAHPTDMAAARVGEARGYSDGHAEHLRPHQHFTARRPADRLIVSVIRYLPMPKLIISLEYFVFHFGETAQ
jgi:hypothetical protein